MADYCRFIHMTNNQGCGLLTHNHHKTKDRVVLHDGCTAMHALSQEHTINQWRI